MANATKKNAVVTRTLGGVPYGNLTAFTFNLTTTAAGIWSDSDLATNLVTSTVVRLGVLPKGFKILDYINKISTASPASVTGKVGFAYVDGVDVAPNADDDYFCGATTLATAAVLRQTNTGVAPITLAKDAYLQLVVAGAHIDAAMELNIIVIGICDQL